MSVINARIASAMNMDLSFDAVLGSSSSVNAARVASVAAINVIVFMITEKIYRRFRRPVKGLSGKFLVIKIKLIIELQTINSRTVPIMIGTSGSSGTKGRFIICQVNHAKITTM